MDGVFVRCQSRDPVKDKQCVRLSGHDGEHMHPAVTRWSDE